MKLAICVYLLVLGTAVQAVSNKGSSLKTDKRALSEGNAGVRKREPALPSGSSSANAGVEYADTKQQLQDKSPSQQSYANPLPQVAKISDLLAAQGPSFQAAIANQLFAPIPAYQPRAEAPTTYDVSAPVPSQLAYSEHRIGYQQPNAIQYNPQDYAIKLPRQQEYNQPQALAQPQASVQPQVFPQTQLLPKPELQQAQQYNQQPLQQFYQPIPPSNYQSQLLQQPNYSPQSFKQFENQVLQGLQYQQAAGAAFPDNQGPAQFNLPQQYYQPQQQYQPQEQYQPQQQYQPQLVQQQYAQEPVQNVQFPQFPQPSVAYTNQVENQQKIYNPPVQKQIYDNQQFVAQNYQSQPQGPVSFTNFQHNRQNPSIIHHPFHQQPQYSQESPSIQEKQPSLFRQGAQLQQVQSQVQPQYLTQGQSKPPAGYRHAPAPTFPAVQYFGKYAQSIFNKPQN